jgi:hypothetical protein
MKVEFTCITCHASLASDAAVRGHLEERRDHQIRRTIYDPEVSGTVSEVVSLISPHERALVDIAKLIANASQFDPTLLNQISDVVAASGVKIAQPVNKYEEARVCVVYAFYDALRMIRAEGPGVVTVDPADALSAAFEIAKEQGWDAEKDEDFTSWCLKATHQEICTEGLVRALKHIDTHGPVS